MQCKHLHLLNLRLKIIKIYNIISQVILTTKEKIVKVEQQKNNTRHTEQEFQKDKIKKIIEN